MKAMDFQEATAKAALAAFDRPNGSRRFLIADEVGLGKTVVARRVMQELMARTPDRTLHVLYVCSNLAVAAQNRKSLLACLEHKVQQENAAVPVDRLGLVVRRPELRSRENASNKVPLRLFTLTPPTSLPDWTSKRAGGGTMHERATVQALAETVLGGQFPDSALAQTHSENWPSHLKGAREHFAKNKVDRATVTAVRTAISLLTGWPESELLASALAEAQQLVLPKKHPKVASIRSKLTDRLGAFRVAACLLALDVLEPDLVIFDEFQRFPELVKARSGADSNARKDILVARLRADEGQVRRPLLLLSATPYRLTPHGGQAAAHNDFLAVTRFLLGGTVKNVAHREQCADGARRLESGLSGLREGLMTGLVNDRVRAARDEAEAILRSVMARTERSDEMPRATEAEQPAPASERESEPVSGLDLEVFKHLVDLRLHYGPRAGADVAYWTSVPLPTQTMAGYKSTSILTKFGDPPPPKAAYLTGRAIKGLDARPTRAHAKLRALLDHQPTAGLALPWIAPSLPWWPLAGAWESGPGKPSGPTKILAFSRFVAAPRAVPALISHAVEASVFAKNKRPNPLRGAFETGSRESTANLVLFLPVPELAGVCDPLRLVVSGKTRTREALLRAATDALESRLLHELKTAFEVTPAAKRELPGKLLAKICGVLGASNATKLTGGVVLPVADRDAAVVSQWRRDVEVGRKLKVLRVARSDLAAVAEIIAFGPGNILARSICRHAVASELVVPTLTAAIWSGLRSRLGHPVAMAGIRLSAGKRVSTKRAAAGESAKLLLRATYEGNLESVLDEHLWLLLRQHPSLGLALKEFERQVTPLRSDVRLAVAAVEKPTLRMHVALPFRTEGASSKSKAKAKKDAVPDVGTDLADRPDLIRSVFNGPFWPHILVTTSVGQEGLDFHPWCDTIAHWDLPGSPVDYEQREGRIQRYAGLSVRRGIAAAESGRWPDFLATATREGCSPWAMCVAAVEKAGEKIGKGLSPWWTFPDCDIVRLFPAAEGSETHHDRRRLDQERELYRLVLGQPDQARLVERLLQADPATMAQLRLRLSPAYGERTLADTL